MNVTSKFQSILPSLAEKALTSPINYKLSAVFLGWSSGWGTIATHIVQ